VGPGAIIPFASGLPVTLSTVLGGLVGSVGLVGFGGSTSGITLVGGALDLTGGAGVAINQAFSLPRDGLITSISAYFSTTVALDLIGTTVDLSADLFCSTGPDNIFTPVPGAHVSLQPALTGPVAIGTTANGITTGLAIPITAQSRCVLVNSAAASGLNLVNAVVGYSSGGLSID
jgi:BclB C-terminal domain-containing protein